MPRETGFDIAVASEVMAILALTTSLKDMRERLGRIVIGQSYAKQPVTAEELGVAGAMTVLMKDAIMPNLMQTLEGTPAFVHAGPFANIAHGNSSIIADQIALKLADYVVTETGFGADIGMEKFFDIKCRYSGLIPNVRGAGGHDPRAEDARRRAQGRGRPRRWTRPTPRRTCRCWRRASPTWASTSRTPASSACRWWWPSTASSTTPRPRSSWCSGWRPRPAPTRPCPANHWAKGGEGAIELAEAVVSACEKPSDFQFLYPLDMLDQGEDRDHRHARSTARTAWTTRPRPSAQIAAYEKAGFGSLPICMAKTHLSLSHDPALKGVPTGFTLPIREVRASVGAGFIYPLCGEMRTMPGLPSKPVFMKVDIDENGKVVGLF